MRQGNILTVLCFAVVHSVCYVYCIRGIGAVLVSRPATHRFRPNKETCLSCAKQKDGRTYKEGAYRRHRLVVRALRADSGEQLYLAEALDFRFK